MGYIRVIIGFSIKKFLYNLTKYFQGIMNNQGDMSGTTISTTGPGRPGRGI